MAHNNPSDDAYQRGSMEALCVFVKGVHMFRFIASFIVAPLMFGCATQATLTVQSQPQGAYITEQGTGRVLGVAPVVSYYDASALKQNRQDAQGCYLVRGFEARWVSGATTFVPDTRLCNGTTNDYSITVTRNSSDPGLEKDLQFAMQVQALQLQAQQAQAAQDAATAALIGAFSAAQQRTTPVQCSSYPVGDSVQTTCR